MLSEVTLLWNAGPSSFQPAAAWAAGCCSRDRRAHQRIPDKQLHRPSPAGTHHQPSPDTPEPDRPGTVPCTCAARLPALHESRHGVARASHSQGSPWHREPCPECPRNYAHCLEARRNPEPSCVVGLPIVVLYCSSCIPPHSAVTKKLGDRNRIRGSTPSLCPTHAMNTCPEPHGRQEQSSGAIARDGIVNCSRSLNARGMPFLRIVLLRALSVD